MPRDEPVSSFGRRALKPTEFREHLGLIGFVVFHDVPPCFDDSGNDQLPYKEAPNRGAGEDRNGTLLGVSGSALAADGPAERITKGVSGVLRPNECCRSKLGVCRREHFPHLFDCQAGSWIGYARSVVEELAV